MGEKMDKKSISIEIFVCKFESFSKNSNLNWFFAQTRKDLQLGFLISFRIINDFQRSTKPIFIIIKISFFKSKFAKLHENFQNLSGFHWYFD